MPYAARTWLAVAPALALTVTGNKLMGPTERAAHGRAQRGKPPDQFLSNDVFGVSHRRDRQHSFFQFLLQGNIILIAIQHSFLGVIFNLFPRSGDDNTLSSTCFEGWSSWMLAQSSRYEFTCWLRLTHSAMNISKK